MYSSFLWFKKGGWIFFSNLVLFGTVLQTTSRLDYRGLVHLFFKTWSFLKSQTNWQIIILTSSHFSQVFIKQTHSWIYKRTLPYFTLKKNIKSHIWALSPHLNKANSLMLMLPKVMLHTLYFCALVYGKTQDNTQPAHWS